MSEVATLTETAEPLTGTALAQYQAVRGGGIGWRGLYGRGLIQVTGTEAVQFLNGLITNDVKTLEDGHWMPAAFPNVQGRLIATVRVLRSGDAFYFDTEPATRDAVYQALYRFSFAGDFHVADLTESTAIFTLQGRSAPELLVSIFGDEVAALKQGELLATDFDGAPVKIIRATHTAEDGFDLFVEKEGAVGFRQYLLSTGVKEMDAAAFEVLRIEAGIPVFGVDMVATNVVLEAVADDAVSYTKGCYVGQEIIARIHWRGHVAKKLTGLKITGGPVAPEDKLFTAEDKEIGRVTSAVFSPALDQWVALGYVKYDFLAAGTPVTVKTAGGKYTATVADLPLVAGSWAVNEPAPAAIES
jgi:folate-binding protein YgfZ